jgi:zinc protease
MSRGVTFAAVAATVLAVASARTAAAQDSASGRASPPTPGPLRPYEFPRVERFTLANGVNVVVLERHGLPVVSARIIDDAGALRDSPARSGLAALTGSLLNTGTRALTGRELAERMERYGAAFETGADHLSAGVNLTTLASAFADAFALAATTITEPSFPQAEFDRLQREALANIEQRRASVEGLAPEVFARAVYDSSTAYSRPAEGVPATVRRLERADVVRWYQAAFAPRATTVLIVGDLTPAAARQIVERALGTWSVPAGAGSDSTMPSETAAPASSTAKPRAQTARVILVDRPGSVQSGIAVGQVAIATTDPDYLPMTTVNRVLGGGFNSRINMNLRERHGYTYGAFSRFGAARGSGTLSLVSAVRSDVTDSALVEALAEWRRIARDTIPAPEFRAAVNNLVSSFPNSVQTVQGLRDRVTLAITTGLPVDFYATYRDRIAAVDADAAHAAAARVIRPDTPTVVVVGDLRTVEPRVRALNLGTIEVWDADGNRVR